MTIPRERRPFLAALCFLLPVAIAPSLAAGDNIPFDFLSRINAVAVEHSPLPHIYLATGQGLFAAAPEGFAVDRSNLDIEMTGLAVHPAIPGMLYASGRSREGENLGLIVSEDSGHGWKVAAEGAGGPAGLLFLNVKADPSVIYGFSGKLLISRNGGKSFEAKSAPPGEAAAIAAAAADAKTVYAATSRGLYVSRDEGASWQAAHGTMNRATAVHAAASGKVYAFIVGVGLIEAEPPSLAWKVLSNDFAGHSLLSLAASQSDAARIYAIADTGGIVTSGDEGKTWISFEGSHLAFPEIIEEGKVIYEGKCQECHGVDGVGENPGNIYAKDEYGYVAPPLNENGHAWHHSDESLIESILEGSPRNGRMIPWATQLSRWSAQALAAYIKSLWGFHGHACQGGRHMACMGR